MLSTFVHLSLLLAMIVLLVTSIAISRSAFRFLPIPDVFALREIHWFSAYWTVMIVALHIGMNATRVRGLLSMQRPRSMFWKVIAVVVVAFGINGAMELALTTKLAFRYSIDMWDFNATVLPFFLHWSAVVGAGAVLAYSALGLAQSIKRSA